MLNKVPINNDARHIANNMCLTAMRAQQFSMMAIGHHEEKLTYQK